MATMLMAEQVEAVKAHALAHYDEGGWDVIVESWDDSQIKDVLWGNREAGIAMTRSAKGAIRRIKEIAVDVYADMQADAKNSAF